MRTTSRLARLLRAADRWTLRQFKPTTSGPPGRNERLVRPHDAERTARRGADRRRLERELADATPAERQDLLTVLRRYPAAETDDVREVLERQASRRTLVAGGLPHRP
jgi:hypothetical protein